GNARQGARHAAGPAGSAMILVDGKRSAGVPADDRGLAYGDGLFETMRARKGCLPLLDYHLERLRAGLRVLGMPSPPDALLQAERQAGAREHPGGIVKVLVARGSGGRGYRAPADSVLRRIVTSAPAGDFSDWREMGVALRVCATVLEGPRALGGLK